MSRASLQNSELCDALRISHLLHSTTVQDAQLPFVETEDSAQAAGGSSHLPVNCYHDLGLIISVPLKYKIVNINMPRGRKLRVCIIVAKFNTHLNMQDGTSVQENSVRNGSSVCQAPRAQESCALCFGS